MKGRQLPYSAAELAWIKAHSRDDRRQAHAAFCAKFKRTDVSLSNFNALCKRKGWLTGRTGRLEKGNVPHNKGKPCPEGTGGRHPNSRKTQFVSGERRGVAVKLYKPIGSERLCKDGYLERKVHDGMPLQSRWRAVHLIRWEEINGPIPAGHCLKCLDGDRLNTDPTNWECISRALLPRLVVGKHGQGFDYDAAPAELKPAILAVAKLKHATSSKQPTRLKAERDDTINKGEKNDG